MPLIRGSMLVLALAACAWFAVGIRQTRELSRASAILAQSQPNRAAAGEARSLLSSAGWLNPDSAVDVLRGRLALAQGEAATARTILGSVVRREPDNLQGWVALAQAVLHASPAQLRLTVLNIARLDPRIR